MLYIVVRSLKKQGLDLHVLLLVQAKIALCLRTHAGFCALQLRMLAEG